MPPPTTNSSATGRANNAKQTTVTKTTEHVTRSPYIDPIWACSMCFHSDNVVVHAVRWAIPKGNQSANVTTKQYAGQANTVERTCARCQQSWRPIQVAPSVVEGKWMQVRRPRMNSMKSGTLPRFNMWDPDRGNGLYKLNFDVYPQSIQELVKWCREVAHKLQMHRFVNGDFSLIFEGLRWFQRLGQRFNLENFQQAKQFLQSQTWDMLVDYYINDQLAAHPNNMRLLDRYMPYAPRAFGSNIPDSPSSIYFQLQEIYRSPNSHDGVQSLSSNVDDFRTEILSAHPSPPETKAPQTADSAYGSPILDGCVQKGLSVGQTAAWTVEFVNDSPQVRHVYGITIVDLPIGNFRHRFWENSDPIQPTITVDGEQGHVELCTRHEDLGRSSIAMVGSARLTTADGKQHFMDLESRSVRNNPGNVVSSKISTGMQQVLFQTDLQPGAKLGVQLKCDAVLDAHMRKLVVAMTKTPSDLRSLEDTNRLPAFHPNAAVTVVPEKPSTMPVRGSNNWAAHRTLRLENCVGVMLQALTHTEPDLYRVSKRNVDRDVHPLLVDAIRQLGIVPSQTEGAAVGGNVCHPDDCSGEPVSANNRYGAGQEALSRNDWWEGGDIKKVYWLVPPGKSSQYMYPLPFWTPSPEAVALALFRRAHQPIPDNLRGAARKYTAKLMNTSSTNLLSTENSSLEEAVNEMLITPFAPNVARRNLLPNNYRLRMHNLLVMELTQTMWDLRRFDLVAAKVKRSNEYEADGITYYASGTEIILRLPVYNDQQAHIGDTRPSVLIRDVVRIRPFLYEDISSGKYESINDASRKPTVPGPEVFEAEVISVTPQTITAKLPFSDVANPIFTASGTICSVRYVPSLLPDRFMHRAIEAMHVSRLFPSPSMILPDAWNRERCVTRSDLYDNKLDETQFAIVNNILTSSLLRVPTVVVGPYGCGKTRTLQEVVRQLTTPDCTYRVLVATHTNTSADMYVKALSRHLRPEEMIRIYAERRKESSVSPLARRYTYVVNSTDEKGNPVRVFGVPPPEELSRYKVIITTLVTAGSLMSSGVTMKPGTSRLQAVDEVDPTLTSGASTDFFSHVLVDEAAQASEPEALVALSLAGPQTKIVLVGDHMQLGPDVRHPTARRLGLHRSVLERLYALPVYDGNRAGQCKLALCHNYRSHPGIVRFTSHLFYGSGLVPKVMPNVPTWPAANAQRRENARVPLSFVCTGAKAAERDPISCSWENRDECVKIVEVVTNLLTDVANGGGGVHYSEVAVVAPYSQQVRLLRNHFRQEAGRLKKQYQKSWEKSKNGNSGSVPAAPALEKVRITHVRDVQGLEFGVLVMSTVRTLHDILFGEDEAEGVGGDVEAGAGGLVGGKGDAWTPINVQGIDEVLGAPDDSDDESSTSAAKHRKAPRFTDTRYNAHSDDVGDSDSDEDSPNDTKLKNNFADDTDSKGLLSRRKKPPSIGLFRNTRLFNTSITRAKSMVVGVGDPALLYYDRCWRSMIRAAHNSGTMVNKPHQSQTLQRLDDMITVAKHRYGKVEAPTEVLERFEAARSHKAEENDGFAQVNAQEDSSTLVPTSPLTSETHDVASVAEQGLHPDGAGPSSGSESKLRAQSTPYNPFYRVQSPQLTYAQMQLQMQMQYQMQLQMRINMQMVNLQRLQMIRQQGISDPNEQQVMDNNIRQYQQNLWMLKQQQQQHLSMFQQFQQQVQQQMQSFNDKNESGAAMQNDSSNVEMSQSLDQMGMGSNLGNMMNMFDGMSNSMNMMGPHGMHSANMQPNELNSMGLNAMNPQSGNTYVGGSQSQARAMPSVPPSMPQMAQHSYQNAPPQQYSGVKTRASAMTPSPAAGLAQQVVEIQEPGNAQSAKPPNEAASAPPPPGFENDANVSDRADSQNGFGGLDPIPSSDDRQGKEEQVVYTTESHPPTHDRGQESLSRVSTHSTKPKRRVDPSAPYRAYLRENTGDTLWCYENDNTGETIPQESWFTASQMRQLLLNGSLAAATQTTSADDVKIAMALKKNENDDGQEEVVMKTPFITLKAAFPLEMHSLSEASNKEQQRLHSESIFEDAPEAFRQQISLESP
eukprot:gb/GECG01003483.1/.p1 GENE.gb/GECG01003483.1/~~gb/GECG01003483.1/.p1  ORF type:complete len:2058 (+),score=221.57 gb/GECG01003483.1/:1-6174(+)